MPYITRDEAGHIVGLFECAQEDDQEFLEAAELWTPPASPLEKIRALEAENADDQARATRQAFIALALKEGQALGYDHNQLMQLNAGYRRMYELEQQIAALRELL